MSQAPRRSFIVEPEDGLILSPTAFDAWENQYTFCHTTGLNPDQVVSSIICSAPIPRYAQGGTTPRRFSNVKAKYLWHPFFWLPPKLAQRVSIPDAGGEPYLEDWDAYALRIALEMGNSGVFNHEGWIDVLGSAGINVDTAEGVRRIEQWQAGKPDPILDHIDTSDLYAVNSEPYWSVTLSRMLVDPARNAQNHLVAVSFLEALEDATPEETLDVYRHIGGLAAIYLRSIKFPEALSGEFFWDRIVEETHNEFYKNNVEGFLARPAAVAKQWLQSLISETEGTVEFMYSVLAPDFGN